MCAPHFRQQHRHWMMNNPKAFIAWAEQVPLPQGWVVGYDHQAQWAKFLGPNGETSWIAPSNPFDVGNVREQQA